MRAAMSCSHCGQNNFSWARTCTQCGHSLTPAVSDAAASPTDPAPPHAPEVQPPVAQRDLQLALPDTMKTVDVDPGEIHEALAHTPPPRVMPVLVAINVLVFLAMVITGVGAVSPDTQALLRWGGTYAPSITRGEWWRLFTAMFVHAGVIHLLFNMVALLNIGAVVERMVGRVPFVVLYLLSGVGGSIASVYWHPLAVGVGASGAIFGLYGGLGGFLLRAPESLPRHIVASLRSSAVGFVLYNTVFGFTQANIDMVAHFGGLAAGFAVGLSLALIAVPAGTSLRSALAVGIGGAAMLALAAAGLPAFDDWPGSLRTLGELERADSELTRTAMQQVTDGRIDSATFARRLEEQVIAPWRRHRDRIAAMKRLPEKERRLAATALQYMDHRAAAWQLTAEAFRTEDMALMVKSNAELEAANNAAQDLVRALGITVPDSGRASSAPAVVADAGERDLTKAFDVVHQLDTASVQLLKDDPARVRAGGLSPSALADLVDARISEPWDRQINVVAALHTTGPVEGSRKRLEQYMRLRGEGWHLLAKSFRTGSAPLAEQANALFAKAAAFGSTGSSARPAGPSR